MTLRVVNLGRIPSDKMALLKIADQPSLTFAFTYGFSCGLVILIWRLFLSNKVRGLWELLNE
jgi:hypothetical protein